MRTVLRALGASLLTVLAGCSSAEDAVTVDDASGTPDGAVDAPLTQGEASLLPDGGVDASSVQSDAPRAPDSAESTDVTVTSSDAGTPDSAADTSSTPSDAPNSAAMDAAGSGDASGVHDGSKGSEAGGANDASNGLEGGDASSAADSFNPCRFHFGTIDSIAKANPTMIPQLDFFTPGWMGQSDTFDMSYVCTEGNSGGALADQVPVIVAYVAAFYAKRHYGLCDCNVTTCGTNNDLCHQGAKDILQDLTEIVNVYKSYAQGFAGCYGTTRPIVFEMEPDWYQYTYTTIQTQAMTTAQAGTIIGEFVAAVRQYLPNAYFSMDISPWVDNNGADNGAAWYANFDMTKFTFINTSGGGTDATSTFIRSSNKMTWAGVSQVTGKPILADTGYGVNGSSAGPDPNWNNVTNINARMADGVVGISQYNPASNWGSTIASIRSQLNAPKVCP